MADKELAIKLAKRFNKLSFDADEGARTFANSSQVPQTVIPEAPPLPPQGQQTPPFRTVSGDEYTDMDKLIEQTLHNMEVTSRETPTNPFTSVYMPQSKSSRIGDAITSQVKIHEPQVVESSNLSPLLPKCTAPIVPIIHHKGSQHEKSMKFVSDDLLLQKERDELEAKLAKQRQKRSTVPAGTENTTHFAVNGSEELRMTSETTISQLSPIGSPLPPPVFPKSTSIDPVLMESQKIESQWEKPPPTSKKPTCSPEIAFRESHLIKMFPLKTTAFIELR
uniref:Uncharacterized protein n=1 Tax=Setaria digitata TaxID=48799 RepID=A0A915Q7A3_9BILA